VEIVARNPAQTGFEPIPKRWIVERRNVMVPEGTASGTEFTVV
jgi:hypothetical protein